MNVKILIMGFLMATLGITGLQAQDENSLIGKWKSNFEMEGEKHEGIYEIKSVDGEIKAYSVQYKNSKNEIEKVSEVVLDKIKLKNNQGEGRLITEYEGETYKIDSELELKDQKTLKIEFSYYGYSDKEVWIKIE
jgi:hypothetical protein